MIGLKKRDIKKALKAGAKAGGMSLADVRENIEATIDEAIGDMYKIMQTLLMEEMKDYVAHPET